VASAIAHAAVALARGAAGVPEELDRRLFVATIACACWPDLDYGTLLFEVRPNETFGHRGGTHSLFVAIVVAAIVAFAFFRAQFLRVFSFLAVAGASHGILDAMTAGDLGVALFWPLTSARFHFPFALLASCPVGMNEYFGYWGILTIANEVLYVVLPIALVVSIVTRPDRRRVFLMGGVWLIALVALRVFMPDEFRPTKPRLIEPIDTERAGKLADLPRDDLPNGTLVTRFDDLRTLGLFDRDLAPAQETWSSSFFPTWFGSEGGRWMDGPARLVWRTMFGFAPVTEERARAMSDAERFRLSPVEKLDIALGHADFSITKQALLVTHNRRPRPRYWNGRCNGVAAASIEEPEPFRVVDVIAKDGTHVRFHPNDIKTLLAIAYDKPTTQTVVGEVCGLIAFDAGAVCSMNPAVLVIAVANRIGLAKKSFLIDALPTIAKQYYAVASARVHAADPRAFDAKTAPHVDASLDGKIARLVDADITMTLSSTTLPESRGDRLDPKSRDGSRYERVGLVPVVMHYSAILALDTKGELVGGRWTGDPADGPDDVMIVSGGPSLVDGDTIEGPETIPWSFVQKLAHASVSDADAMPTIDLRSE
jgi:inner membrane protein